MRTGRGERGQTATEYLMIAGLMTAMLIVLTSIIVPTMKTVGVKVVEHMKRDLFEPQLQTRRDVAIAIR